VIKASTKFYCYKDCKVKMENIIQEIKDFNF